MEIFTPFPEKEGTVRNNDDDEGALANNRQFVSSSVKLEQYVDDTQLFTSSHVGCKYLNRAEQWILLRIEGDHLP